MRNAVSISTYIMSRANIDMCVAYMTYMYVYNTCEMEKDETSL